MKFCLKNSKIIMDTEEYMTFPLSEFKTDGKTKSVNPQIKEKLKVM